MTYENPLVLPEAYCSRILGIGYYDPVDLSSTTHGTSELLFIDHK